jgi:hypothetical protein
MDDQIIIKKVKPYPISAVMTSTEGKPQFNGEIIRLTPVGFQMRIGESTYHPGERWICSFTIPVMIEEISETMVVVKNVFMFDEKDKKKRLRILELHFKDPSERAKRLIHEFNLRVGQK